MSKRIDQLSTVTNAQVQENARLWAIGDSATGQLYKATGAQLKEALQTFKKIYVATGSEGTTLTISELAGKEILLIAREGLIIYEVSISPDTVEFTFNGTSITLGLGVNFAGERFLILYKSI